MVFDHARRIKGERLQDQSGGGDSWHSGGYEFVPSSDWYTDAYYFRFPTIGFNSIGTGQYTVAFLASLKTPPKALSFMLSLRNAVAYKSNLYDASWGFNSGKLIAYLQSYTSVYLSSIDYRNQGIHNFAVVRRNLSSTGIEGYADGLNVGTAEDSNTYVAPSNIFVGRGIPSQSFCGLAQYLYFWDRALSPAELMAIHQSPYCMFKSQWVPFSTTASAVTNLSATSLNALIQKAGISSQGSLGALLMQTLSRTAGIDGFLQETGTGQAILDAIIKLSTTGAISLDALVMGIRTGAFSLDALITILGQQSTSLDAFIRIVATGSLSLDALVANSYSSGAILDAFLRAGQTDSLLMDSLIKAALAGVVSLDALVMGIRTGVFSLDAFIRTIYQTGLSLDALVARVVRGSASLDSLILGSALGVTSLDAFVMPEAWGWPYQSEIKAPIRRKEISAKPRRVTVL